MGKKSKKNDIPPRLLTNNRGGMSNTIAVFTTIAVLNSTFFK